MTQKETNQPPDVRRAVRVILVGYLILMALTFVAFVAASWCCGAEPIDQHSGYLAPCEEEAFEVSGDWLASIPPDDAGKFHIVLFSGPGCAPCEQLKRDFEADPNLAKLKAWANWHEYNWQDTSQRHRFASYKVTTFPTLVIVPPRGSTQYPYTYVERMSGYNGDRAGLFQRLAEKLRAFCQRFRPQRDPLPIPDGPPGPLPDTRPVVSTPIPDGPPGPLPDTRPVVSTPIPDLPIRIVPEPASPAPGPVPASYPDYIEAVLIVDPEGLGERLKVELAERLIERFAARSGLEPKTRIINYEDAAGRYPVDRNDTPAICVTKGGRLIGYLSVGMVQALRADEAAVDPPAPAEPAAGLEQLRGDLLDGLSGLRDRLAELRSGDEEAGGQLRDGLVTAIRTEIREGLAERLRIPIEASAGGDAAGGEPDPAELVESVSTVASAVRYMASGSVGLGLGVLGFWLVPKLFRRAKDSGRLDEATEWIGDHRPSQLLQQGLARFQAAREATERTRRETAELAKQAADQARAEQEAAESVARALAEEPKA